MQERAINYGPIYKERVGFLSSIILSDPNEYKKVFNAEGKHPHRLEMMPMKHYLEKHGRCLGLTNS